MSILQLADVKASNKAEALKIIDELREAIDSGAAVCFAGVTLDRTDSVRAWTATTEPVSRLRTMGAVSHLLACLHSGEA